MLALSRMLQFALVVLWCYGVGYGLVFTSVQCSHCPHAALICTGFGFDDDHGLAMGFGYRWWSVSLRVSVVTDDEIWSPDGYARHLF